MHPGAPSPSPPCVTNWTSWPSTPGTTDVVVFATACPVPPQAKDQAAAHARALNLPQSYYRGRLELDERLKAQPDTEREFFGPPSAPAPPAHIDLHGAQVGGSTFVGEKHITTLPLRTPRDILTNR